jgi:hypothetical protein
MERNIGKELRGRNRNKACSLLFAATILLDQTIAVVGHRVITLSDVRAEVVLSSLLEKKRVPPLGEEIPPEETESALQSLVQRTLINNYLDNLGLVPNVPPERLSKMKGTLQNLLGSADETKKYLASKGVPESALDGLLRGRLRSEIFAEQHLPFRVNVTTEEVQAYYEAEKGRRFLGKPFESVAPIVRADLRREKVKKEFEKWLETEMRRTEVVYLNK